MAKDAPQRRIDTQRAARAGSVTISGVSTGGSAPHAHADLLSIAAAALLYTPLTRTISTPAAGGLQGGGTLAADRTISLLLAAASGLSLSGSGLALGTPSQLSVSSGNAVSGASHTHAIETSSSPTGASILASTMYGGLTLKSLGVQGNLAVTDGGDLNVGTVLQTNVSQGNIGVNCAPDPQFALDVLGAMRADWLVGKHAIQLDGALLIAHYDGRLLPGNESGETNGHMGQIGTVTGALVHRPGKFGKAAVLGPAVTNYVFLGGFENYSSGLAVGWSAYATGSATGARTQDDRPLLGNYCQLLTRTGGAAGDRFGIAQSIPVSIPATAATASVWVRPLSFSAGAVVRLYVDYASNPGETAALTLTSNHLGKWTRLDVSSTITSGGGANVYVWIEGGNASVLVDCAQIEPLTYATPWVQGARAAEGYITYPASGNVVAERGTVMLWARLAGYNGGIHSIWSAGNATSALEAIIASGASLSLRINGANRAAVTNFATTYVNQWVHLAFTWDATANACAVYVNGALAASGTMGGTTPPPLGAWLFVGGGYWGAGVRWNGEIDDFVVLDRVATADEVRSVVESDAPVFAETSRYGFRATPSGSTFADDEGLWAFNGGAGTVLGVYSGDSSKSWGGATLATGDALLGDYNRGAALLWDDSAGSLLLGKAGAGAAQLIANGASLRFLLGGVESINVNAADSSITLGRVASGYSNLLLSSGAIRLRNNTTDVISLLAAEDSAGNIGTIDGALAFTANGRIHVTNGTTKEIRIGPDGMRVRQQPLASINVPQTMTAIRWLGGGVDVNPDTSTTFSAAVGYWNTTYNLTDLMLVNVCGTGTYNSLISRVVLQAGHYESAVTYKSANLVLSYGMGTSGVGALQYAGEYAQFDSTVRLVQKGSAPASPASNGDVQVYAKGAKFVVAYNHGGTMKYRYTDLTATANPPVWVYTTTAP